ncbi:hypothetical protein [Solibacillus sp. FSL H8-0538]|uniref:hypothetical protein n=1 Tax=Solibacillus sp. FSL H8-0538 TaxID=2921400 RepID=UPI0030FBE2FF
MKKLIAIIVEGPSDEVILATGLNDLLDDENYRIKVFHGNLLTSDQNLSSQKSSKALIGDFVKKQIIEKLHLKKNDISHIIQLADIDGVYNTEVTLTAIRELHQTRLNELSTTSQILDVPYALYYMSRNLEDVLIGKADCTDAEKKQISEDFIMNYSEEYEKFKAFFESFTTNKFSDFHSSWQFIKENTATPTTNIVYFFDLIEGIYGEPY